MYLEIGFTCAVAYSIYTIIKFIKTDCDLSLASKSLPLGYFEGKVVWITGASSGIGESLVHHFSRAGALLILSSRNKKELERVRDSLPKGFKGPGQVYILPADLTDIAALEGKAAEARKAFGHIDVLVNNAGTSTRCLSTDLEFHVIQKIMTLNFLAPVKLTHLLLPNMLDRGCGHVVNISSLAGRFSAPLRASYSGSKFAIIGYMGSLNLETKSKGVTMTTICPGPVKTNVSENALTANGEKYGKADPYIENGMDVDRCAELILIATAHKLNEVWISDHPTLLLAYINQYFPSLSFYFLQKKALEYEVQFAKK